MAKRLRTARQSPARQEAREAARILRAELEFVDLDGDGRLEMRAANTRAAGGGHPADQSPAIVLAPTPVENQHPDHSRLGRLVRNAARLARYGGIAELRALPAHAIGSLLFLRGDLRGGTAGRAARPGGHFRCPDAGRLAGRDGSARLAGGGRGLTPSCNWLARGSGECGPGSVSRSPLFPNDPLVFPSLASLAGSARCF